MITRSVTVEEIDDLYLAWNGHINGSALYRQALRNEMDVRNVDPHTLRSLVSDARKAGFTHEDLKEETDSVADLRALVGDKQESDTPHHGGTE